MFKFFPMFLIVFFLSTPAFSDPTMTGEQMLAHCQEKWESRISAVVQCVNALRFAKSEATDVAIVARLDEGEERDSQILASVDELTESVDRLSATQPTITANSGVSYVRTGGANWMPVAEPFVMSIHDIEDLHKDTLRITDLTHPTARKKCGGEDAPLVIFLDHGDPGSNVYAPQGVTTGFVEVRYDRDNDGTPDGRVLALDLESQTDVWVTWGLKNDLTVRYLRSQRILVEVAPGQWVYETVYHPSQETEISATGAIACEMWSGIRRGGHQAIPVYSLSRAR